MLAALFAEICLRPQALATQIRHLLKCRSLKGMSASAQGMVFCSVQDIFHVRIRIPCTQLEMSLAENRPHAPCPRQTVFGLAEHSMFTATLFSGS